MSYVTYHISCVVCHLKNTPTNIYVYIYNIKNSGQICGGCFINGATLSSLNINKPDKSLSYFWNILGVLLHLLHDYIYNCVSI